MMTNPGSVPGKHKEFRCFHCKYLNIIDSKMGIGACGNENSDHYGHVIIPDWHPLCPNAEERD